MKKTIILLNALMTLSLCASAQQTYNTIEYIDINNINAGHLVHGDMWRNPITATAACEYPKGSGKHVATLGSLWLGGYDEMGILRVAAQTYRQQGSDYFPGPVDMSINTVAAANQHAAKWARIWKVNRSTIDSFKALTTHTTANTPASILEWPAKGNTYAKGAQQSALTISTDMAPFVDVNGDGIYNPLSGDYPKTKGDQMLWSVFNDYMQIKGNTQSGNIGLEIQQSVYAYKRGSSVDNMVFYEYNIKNEGNHILSAFRMGINADMDLGYVFDDYVGFDSSRRMGYVYNATNPDGLYGANIPAAGISIMEFPGDNYPALVPAGSFLPYDNVASANGNPATPIEYNNFLNGRNRLGNPMHDDRASGTASNAFGSGPTVRYAFPDNPNDLNGWSMCKNAVPYSDRRFVLGTDSLTFFPGESKKIGMALIVSPDAGACGTLNLAGLQQLSDSALIVYYNPPAALGIHSVKNAARTLKVYPNPANDELHILSPDAVDATIRIYDASGRQVSALSTNKKSETIVVTSKLAAGMYLVEYRSGETVANNVFVKE